MTDGAYDAVVVGAGPNGLSAAVYLARAGYSVLVLESEDTVGGGTRTKELTGPGFRHDVCSAILPFAAASPWFRELGLSVHGLKFVQPDAALAHPLDDGSAVLLERSVAATADRLDEDGRAYARLVGSVVDHWDELSEQFFAPLLPPRHPVLMARFGLTALRSAAGLARARFKTERARALFAGLAAHAVLPLERAATASFGLVLGASGHVVGWPFPRGGSQAVADALVSALTMHGGEVETGRRVNRFADMPRARVVLFDVTPRALVEIAGDALPQNYRKRLMRFRHGPGVFKMDFALDGPIPWKADDCNRSATVHVGGTLDEIADCEATVARGDIPDKPFLIVAQQSLFDDTRSPRGKHTAWTYCHVPNGSTIDMTERIESQIERFAPGFRDRIIARHVMSPHDLESYNSNYVGGDISAGSHDGLQLFARPVARLTPYSTPNDSIFLCSASTPPGAGVHGMCGYYAARAAEKRLRRPASDRH